jgi:3-deoxy-D-manno-octulosonate 8-phosphate phosphatase (KDO 8-P phosphatase)
MKLDNNVLKAKKIKLLILDVDGVLTDGGLYFNDKGEEMKRFHSLDGHGLKMLQSGGIEVAIITARQSKLLKHRMKNLEITRVFQGQKDKIKALEVLKKELNLDNEQIAYVGDDVIDLPVMTKVGLSIAVANAHDEVVQYAHFQTKKIGGNGAVREVCDYLLQSQKRYKKLMEEYIS